MKNIVIDSCLASTANRLCPNEIRYSGFFFVHLSKVFIYCLMIHQVRHTTFFCSWSLLTIHISIQSPNARLNNRRPFDFYTPKMETFKGHVECTLFCLLCICFRQRFQEQTEFDRLYLWFVSFRLCLLSAETEMNSSYRNDWEYL